MKDEHLIVRRMEVQPAHTPSDDNEGYSLWTWGLLGAGVLLVMIGVLAR